MMTDIVIHRVERRANGEVHRHPHRVAEVRPSEIVVFAPPGKRVKDGRTFMLPRRAGRTQIGSSVFEVTTETLLRLDHECKERNSAANGTTLPRTFRPVAFKGASQ